MYAIQGLEILRKHAPKLTFNFNDVELGSSAQRKLFIISNALMLEASLGATICLLAPPFFTSKLIEPYLIGHYMLGLAGYCAWCVATFPPALLKVISDPIELSFVRMQNRINEDDRIRHDLDINCDAVTLKELARYVHTEIETEKHHRNILKWFWPTPALFSSLVQWLQVMQNSHGSVEKAIIAGTLLAIGLIGSMVVSSGRVCWWKRQLDIIEGLIREKSESRILQ